MLAPGQILQERYQLQQQLGRTAAGRKTWLALDLQAEPQERVAIKLLAFSPEMQWDELKLFEREAHILETLNHPRIPRYRDYFCLEPDAVAGLPWFALVQEYIPGANLQELLERGKRFEEAQLHQLAADLLDILIYLHELSPPVLHRDIKPSNLILADGDRIYLIDFGSVQDKAAVTGMTFTVVGTSGYAPLEQFWGRAVPASDLYALGATLIHLLTGISPADLPQQENRIQFSDRVSLSSGLVRWIEKLTEPAVEKRFSTARQALQALESGLYRVAEADTYAARMEIEAMLEKDIISIHKSEDKLVIYLSPNRDSNCFELLIGTIAFTLIILYAKSILMEYFVFWVFWAAFFIGLLGYISWFINNINGRANKKHIKVEFNRDYFEIKHIKNGRAKAKFNSCYTQKGLTAELYGVIWQQDELKVNRILLLSRQSTYEINLDFFLSDHKCAMLVREIQAWLFMK